MQNLLNLWKGNILYSEVEKQNLILAKTLFMWGIIGTLTAILSLMDLKEMTFGTFVFIFLQLLIQLGSIGIYEGNSTLSVNKALEKSELFANVCILGVSIIFYIIFHDMFSITSILIAIGTCGWSYQTYKEKKK